jgi:hypothetical protein
VTVEWWLSGSLQIRLERVVVVACTCSERK